MNKCYVLLDLYSTLINGGEISITECCNEYNISIPTFRRYIACLRNYCLEKEGKEIVYNALQKVYKIGN